MPFLTIVLLVLAQICLSGISVDAQGQEPEGCVPGTDPDQAWLMVCLPIPPSSDAPFAPPGGDEIMQPYRVGFAEEFASAPPVPNAEFMVVVVKRGFFALEAYPDSHFVVYPAGEERILYLQPYQVATPHYPETSPPEYVKDAGGNDCIRVCLIPADTVVQLKAGDRVVAREGSLCYWCLLNSNATEKDETGVLELFVLRPASASPETFSWIESWHASQDQQASTQRPQLFSAMSWAFHPQARCRP